MLPTSQPESVIPAPAHKANMSWRVTGGRRRGRLPDGPLFPAERLARLWTAASSLL